MTRARTRIREKALSVHAGKTGLFHRGFNLFVAITAQHVKGLLVGKDKQEIGFFYFFF
jgi:hypothetical protein